jgi:3-deoxy-7-phosphoheptulonate synthase
MLYPTDDLRINWIKVLLPPIFLEEELPASEGEFNTIHTFRREICDILDRHDDRLLVVVGPCSIHDVDAALEYAHLLKGESEKLSDTLRIVMRVYFEKPRTTSGWKGLINDPGLDESFRINDGLKLARRLLLALVHMGLPAATEFLDMVVPQYVMGLISWGAVGARTVESQIHRQLASGLSCPVGFKNATSGDVQVAIQAIQSAAQPHCFLGHTKHGQTAIFATSGNRYCHVILRGGGGGVNYTSDSVARVSMQLRNAGVPPRLMIDCSHGNCGKDVRKQFEVCHDVAGQVGKGEQSIVGVMVESNLVEGVQELRRGRPLVYGQSVTDPCLGWAATQEALNVLAEATRSRQCVSGRARVSGSVTAL